MFDLKSTIQEIRFLTESQQSSLINGTPDLGNNCYENSFITMCLLKLYGFDALHCEGCTTVVDKTTGLSLLINPHSWTGSPSFGVVDFSLPTIGNEAIYSVYKNSIAEQSNWKIHISSEPTLLSKVLDNPNYFPEDRYIFYYPKGGRKISILDVLRGASITGSPKTIERMQPFSQDLLAKVALHVYLYSKKERPSLSNHQQHKAFEILESWDIDAKKHLVQQGD